MLTSSSNADVVSGKNCLKSSTNFPIPRLNFIASSIAACCSCDVFCSSNAFLALSKTFSSFGGVVLFSDCLSKKDFICSMLAKIICSCSSVKAMFFYSFILFASSSVKNSAPHLHPYRSAGILPSLSPSPTRNIFPYKS